VCDQGKPNEGAIRLLNDETKEYYIKHNLEYRDEFYEVVQENGERTKIVHLFDVPHLIKCTRNNLLTKNLSFEMDGIKRVAKWQHLEELYHIDSALPDSKMLPRLSDYHVISQKIPKMKVRYATRVFSQRVSAVMNFLSCKSLLYFVITNFKNIFFFFLL